VFDHRCHSSTRRITPILRLDARYTRPSGHPDTRCKFHRAQCKGRQTRPGWLALHPASCTLHLFRKYFRGGAYAYAWNQCC
jgi:hypothetical protein